MDIHEIIEQYGHEARNGRIKYSAAAVRAAAAAIGLSYDKLSRTARAALMADMIEVYAGNACGSRIAQLKNQNHAD